MGLTPPYLDPNCHEALFDVDVGMYPNESHVQSFLQERERPFSDRKLNGVAWESLHEHRQEAVFAGR